MNNREIKHKAPLHERRRNRRAKLMGAFFTICLLALSYRIWYWQSVHGDQLVREAVEQEARTQALGNTTIVAERGQIKDRNSMPIALSKPVYTVFLDVREAARRRNPSGRDLLQETITVLHETFDIPRAYLEAIFARDIAGDLVNDTHYYPVAWEVPANIALPLRDDRSFPDIHAREESLRWYTDPFFAPHIIGFRWGDSLHGLESRYNTQLTGVPGRLFRTLDSHGNPRVETENVRHGLTLITTLDSDIQRLAQSIVDDTFRNIPSRQVGMLVMDPHTGEMLAMAQAPSFSLADPGNPEYFTDPRVQANWENMCDVERTEHRLRTWSNFHISHSFEPGSIFKPIVIAAALEEGAVSLHDRFYCSGSINIADRTVYCWYRRGHGSLTLSGVLYRSCNVAMTEINRRLGRDAFYRYRRYFGFGERTGIDLPGEFDVSSPAVMYTLQQLNAVQLATSSIGQGFNSTNIQSINAFASLINGGNLMQPFLVSQIVDTHGNVVYENLPTVVRRTVSTQTADFMRIDMQQVVSASGGTGWRSAIPGYAIGGKTGTAQQGRGESLTGLTLTYIAYTPVVNPEFIVLMVIDHVEDTTLSSGTTVAPIVREFFEELIQIRSLRPSDGPYAYEHWTTMIVRGEEMPDLTGQRVLDVVRNLNNQHLDFQIVGNGTVVSSHMPPHGRPMPQRIPVILYTDPETRVENMVTVPRVEGLPVAQAEMLLSEVLLTAVLATDRQNDCDAEDFTPGTAQAEEREPGGSNELPPLYIYRQFPAPGTEVEQGFQVRLIPGR